MQIAHHGVYVVCRVCQCCAMLGVQVCRTTCSVFCGLSIFAVSAVEVPQRWCAIQLEGEEQQILPCQVPDAARLQIVAQPQVFGD